MNDPYVPPADPMILHCPLCAFKHVDEGEWAIKSHRKHLCLKCGHEWKPSFYPTVGVMHLAVKPRAYEREEEEERIDDAMANTAVDDILAGNPADPYAAFAAAAADSAVRKEVSVRPVGMHPVLGAPYLTELETLRIDAARWKALMNVPRLRFIGSGSLGTPHAHLCMEIWGAYPNLNSEDRADVIVARRILLQFVDGIRK